mmetsp:Transcript_143397/g.458390  ORF Transcript_143397/g.458390 Transcript_143397/m.458390 type:complete len:407 (-) Transcript_143397:299-1519(-)
MHIRQVETVVAQPPVHAEVGVADVEVVEDPLAEGEAGGTGGELGVRVGGVAAVGAHEPLLAVGLALALQVDSKCRPVSPRVELLEYRATHQPGLLAADEDENHVAGQRLLGCQLACDLQEHAHASQVVADAGTSVRRQGVVLISSEGEGDRLDGIVVRAQDDRGAVAALAAALDAEHDVGEHHLLAAHALHPLPRVLSVVLRHVALGVRPEDLAPERGQQRRARRDDGTADRAHRLLRRQAATTRALRLLQIEGARLRTACAFETFPGAPTLRALLQGDVRTRFLAEGAEDVIPRDRRALMHGLDPIGKIQLEPADLALQDMDGLLVLLRRPPSERARPRNLPDNSHGISPDLTRGSDMRVAPHGDNHTDEDVDPSNHPSAQSDERRGESSVRTIHARIEGSPKAA